MKTKRLKIINYQSLNCKKTPSPKYGQSIDWTNISGNRTKVTVSNCDTRLEAYLEVIKFAARRGWTMPRWWQFWRWWDARPAPPINEMLAMDAIKNENK